MLSCSASSGKPDFNSPNCIVAWYFCGVSQYLHDWDIRYRRCFLGCGGIFMAGIFDIADTFWDAVVSAQLGYSLLQMLFSCQSCIIASAIYLFQDLQMLTSTKLHLQPAYSMDCRCFHSKNSILNLLILRFVDTSHISCQTAYYKT